MSNRYMKKMFNVFNHQVNENQNHEIMSLPLEWLQPKDKRLQVFERTWRKETPCALLVKM